MELFYSTSSLSFSLCGVQCFITFCSVRLLTAPLFKTFFNKRWQRRWLALFYCGPVSLLVHSLFENVFFLSGLVQLDSVSAAVTCLQHLLLTPPACCGSPGGDRGVKRRKWGRKFVLELPENPFKSAACLCFLIQGPESLKEHHDAPQVFFAQTSSSFNSQWIRSVFTSFADPISPTLQTPKSSFRTDDPDGFLFQQTSTWNTLFPM